MLFAAIALLSGWGARPLEAAPPSPQFHGADSSAQVPRARVLWRALRADTSQKYLVYVPRQGGQGAPVFVDAHGYSRNVEQHAALLAPYAESYGVVLVAPYFDRERHDDYQRLGRKGRGPRADLALDAIVEEVEILTGAVGEKLYLFGFSGGAQFVHRYALAHPDRVARAVVVAAGWYTFPDLAVNYPYGLRLGSELSGVRFDLDAFLQVPITVLVGGGDVLTNNLRKNARVDRQQGKTRRERAHNWTAAMRRAAERRGFPPVVTCEEVPNVAHSFEEFMAEGRLGDRVFAALFGAPRSADEKPVERVPALEHARSR